MRLLLGCSFAAAFAIAPAIALAEEAQPSAPGKTLTEIAALMDRLDVAESKLDATIKRTSADSQVALPPSSTADAEKAHEEMILRRLRREGAGDRAVGLQGGQSTATGSAAETARKSDEGGAFEADPRTRKQFLARLQKDKKELGKHREGLKRIAKDLSTQMENGKVREQSQRRAESDVADVKSFLADLDSLLASNGPNSAGNAEPGSAHGAEASAETKKKD